MKHIKKKYFLEREMKKFIKQNINKEGFVLIDDKSLEDPIIKNSIKFILLSDACIPTFEFEIDAKTITVLLPDYMLSYFDMAYKLNKEREFLKGQMSEILKIKLDDKLITEEQKKLVFDYYQYSSNCIINLFTCIEAFVNYLIRSVTSYTSPKNNKVYKNIEIQKNINFNEKVENVLLEINYRNYGNNNDFSKTHPELYECIKALQQVRNSIVHLKYYDKLNMHFKIYRDLLEFDYNSAFNSVIAFVNFYRKGYIEECDCGRDF